jgi:hypothetical protein
VSKSNKSKTSAKKKSTKAIPRKVGPKSGAASAARVTPKKKGAQPVKEAQRPAKSAGPPTRSTSGKAEEPRPPSSSSRARALVLDESDPKKAVAALQKFGSTQLQRVFADLFHTETASRSVTFLRSAIAKGLVDKAAGAPLTPPVEEQRTTRKITTSRDHGTRDARLPEVGTTIERVYKGETLRVKVLEEGFSFKGTTYPSLSALAKTFTKCSTNGFLWFGLTQRPLKAAAPEAGA